MILSKLEIAGRQLEVAAELYIAGADYLAVVTLAGASEEILGSLLRRAGQEAMIDELVELDRKITGGREYKIVAAEVNRARNALKHAYDATEDTVLLEPAEAKAMIARALVNYIRLGGILSENMIHAYKKLAGDVQGHALQI